MTKALHTSAGIVSSEGYPFQNTANLIEHATVILYTAKGVPCNWQLCIMMPQTTNLTACNIASLNVLTCHGCWWDQTNQTKMCNKQNKPARNPELCLIRLFEAYVDMAGLHLVLLAVNSQSQTQATHPALPLGPSMFCGSKVVFAMFSNRNLHTTKQDTVLKWFRPCGYERLLCDQCSRIWDYRHDHTWGNYALG